jgi:hypothetical protein
MFQMKNELVWFVLVSVDINFQMKKCYVNLLVKYSH